MSPPSWNDDRRPHGRRPATDPYIDNAILNALSAAACGRAEDLLDELGVKVRRSGRRYVGPCPVHEGRKPSFYFFPDGYEARGTWGCYTGKCQEVFRKSLLGLVRGVLSREEKGWGRGGDPVVSHYRAVDWVCKFLGTTIQKVRVDRPAVSREDFNREADLFILRAPPAPIVFCSDADLRAWCPTGTSHYYESRGFRPETLRQFEVGDCLNPTSPMRGRVIFPVRDPAGDRIVGAVTRSLDPRCDSCNLCHPANAGCPDGEGRWPHLRWRAERPFNDKHVLYGHHLARDHVRATRCLVLAEGAADVMRLHEADIPNAMGLFGSELNPLQESLIVELNPRQIVLVFDRDEAGERGAAAFAREMGGVLNISRPDFTGPEIGDMAADEVRRQIRPFVLARSQKT